MRPEEPRPRAAPPRTTVVCGLLGSGKTTFIQGFLREGTARTVVLVNDFGAAGIDGEILSAGGVEAVELPSGCVCCTLKFDLITTVGKILARFSPEHLVIEPSGVASPSAVLEALASAGVGAATVVGVVDALEFAELHASGMYGRFFEDQIANSDVLLVNKTDLAGEAEIAAAERILAAVNPRALVLRTVRAAIAGALPAAPAGRTVVPGGPHLRFETLSFRLPARSEAEALARFLADLARGRHGRVVRAKALAATTEGPARLDVASGRVERVPFGREISESRLVVIGEGLDRDAIAAAVLGCAAPRAAEDLP